MKADRKASPSSPPGKAELKVMIWVRESIDAGSSGASKEQVEALKVRSGIKASAKTRGKRSMAMQDSESQTS